MICLKVWMLRASEILPLSDNSRLMRMGLLGEELSNCGHEITWFTSSFDHFKKKQHFTCDTEYKIKDNYRLQIIYAKGYKKNISIQRIINHKIIGIKLNKKIQKMEKPDIIFASFPTIEFAEVAVKYGKKHNVPVIIDIRDLWPDIFRHNLKGILKIMAVPYIYILERKTKKILSGCYKITSISDLMLKWGLEKGKKQKTKLDKAFYIGYKNDANNILKINEYSYLFNNNKFCICFFATINNQFNYKFVSELAKSLINDNVDIVVCGNGPRLKYFKSLCVDLNNIKFLDWCSKDTLNYILSNSHIGLAPYNDTFDFQMSVSNKFCEYLSFGLPILITCTGYMESILNKYKIGFSSDNIEKMRKYIIDLRDNKDKYIKTKNNAKDIYNKYFDASKIYPRMVKYIENVKEEYYK